MSRSYNGVSDVSRNVKREPGVTQSRDGRLGAKLLQKSRRIFKSKILMLVK